jgi:hypothetical protein
VETMRKILEGDRRSLGEAAPQAPEPLRDLIERLLAVEPAARIRTASELLDSLASVAPPPSARHALGARIEEQRGGPEARLHVRAREDERDTELTWVPGIATESPDATAGKSRPRRALLFASLVAAAVGILILSSGRVSEPTSPQNEYAAPNTQMQNPEPSHTGAGADTVAVADTGPGADTVADTEADTVAVADADTVADAGAGADTGARLGVAPRPLPKGFVRVVVQPWGNVWIDDRFFGRAPVTARLSKGRHVIEVGHQLRSQRRVVRIQAGTRREVEFTLSEP